jgi:molecular chaperone GrpE
MPHRQVDEAIAEEAVDPATLLAENEALRDRLLRALAEAENTRRRAEQTAQEARQYATADFAREMLLVDDNLKRTAVIEGVRATVRLLEQTLSRFRVRKIDALGKRFDPNLHEAVMQVDDASQPAGTVVRVIEDGYTIHDRLLRPARVFVARARSNTNEVEAAEADPDLRPGDRA